MLRGQRHDQVPAAAGAPDLMGLLQMGVADAGGQRENRNVGEDIVEARSSVTDLIVCNGGRVTLVYCLLVISHSHLSHLCIVCLSSLILVVRSYVISHSHPSKADSYGRAVAAFI